MCRVRDVMTTEVITLAPETSVEQAIDTLVDQRISGAPVVDAEGRLLGVLTEYHLLKIASFPSVQDMTVGELMTKAVWVIAEDANISTAAELLARHRIRRLPVVDRGYVVGVISRRDVIRHLLRQRRELAGMEDLPRLCEQLDEMHRTRAGAPTQESAPHRGRIRVGDLRAAPTPPGAVPIPPAAAPTGPSGPAACAGRRGALGPRHPAAAARQAVATRFPPPD